MRYMFYLFDISPPHVKIPLHMLDTNNICLHDIKTCATLSIDLIYTLLVSDTHSHTRKHVPNNAKSEILLITLPTKKEE